MQMAINFIRHSTTKRQSPLILKFKVDHLFGSGISKMLSNGVTVSPVLGGSCVVWLCSALGILRAGSVKQNIS